MTVMMRKFSPCRVGVEIASTLFSSFRDGARRRTRAPDTSTLSASGFRVRSLKLAPRNDGDDEEIQSLPRRRKDCQHAFLAIPGRREAPDPESRHKHIVRFWIPGSLAEARAPE